MGINNIIATTDKATDKFAKAVTASEQHMFDEVVMLIKDLDTTPGGNIKTSIANLKRVQQIRTKLYKIANNKEYRKAVGELIKSFDTLYQQQLSFYAIKNQTTATQQKHDLIKTIARENTIAALTGDGLAANVTKQLDQMLLRAVTSGEKFADLQKEFRQYLISDKGGSGALSKYANTYAVTALSQYAGQNNKLFTEDLDAEWLEYVGSEIETTRPFCEACLKKRYIHRSEFHDVLKGHIHIIGGKDIDVPIYDKTGLPHGMIEGTNEDNFQVNVGGWNCRHQLIPIAKEAVPKNIRDEIQGKLKIKSKENTKSDTAIKRKSTLTTMNQLLEKKVSIVGNGHTMSVGFSKYGNKHIYSDTFGRSKILQKEDLVDIDQILRSATFVKKVGLSKERKDKIKRFYYYKTTLHDKTIYLNVAETDEYRKGKGLNHNRFLYSITDKIK